MIHPVCRDMDSEEKPDTADARTSKDFGNRVLRRAALIGQYFQSLQVVHCWGSKTLLSWLSPPSQHLFTTTPAPVQRICRRMCARRRRREEPATVADR